MCELSRETKVCDTESHVEGPLIDQTEGNYSPLRKYS